MTQSDTSIDAAPRPDSRSSERLPASIEALLLHADKAIPAHKLAAALGLVSESAGESRGLPEQAKADIQAAVADLNDQYESGGRAFRIETVAGGFRLMTLPEFAPTIAAFRQTRSQNRLSKAAIESLAIIAYRQPVTRAEIEAIRGVACGEVLKTLLDHRLITIQGRAEELGRPMLYGTTRQFLDTFGLAAIKDLPNVEDLGASE